MTSGSPAAESPAPSTAGHVWGVLRMRPTLGRYTGVILGLLAVSIYMSITEPTFLTGSNWSNILRSQAVVLILAIGMTFVVLTGGIDLSIGSLTAASAVALGLAVSHGASWWLGCLVAIAAGMAFGFANGFAIGIFKIPFFVVTLGTLSIYQSLALLQTNQGQTISLFNYSRFEELSTLVNGNVGPIPTVFIFCVALYLIASFVLRYMTFGRAVYAVGANPEAARLSGISVTLVLVSVYTISGLMAGVGAAVHAGRLGASPPQADPTLMLSVVAAVLIGGTSFTGGDGGLFGTFLGALFLGVIQNALQLGDISAFYQGLVSGLILILAVGLGVLREHAVKVRQRAARRRMSMAAASEEPGA